MAILSKTPAEKRAIELTVAALRQYDNMKRAYEQGLRDFWSDPRFTPQELADALGSDASDLFRLHGGLKAAILSVNPEEQLSSVSDYGAFTVNPDGTLTIEDPSLDSPALNSPTLDSPVLDSPSLDSPTLNSPSLDSPTLDSPVLDSPAL